MNRRPMNKDYYDKTIKDMKIRHQKELEGLMVEYAKQNNPYSIGDIFEDHIGKVKIERIKYTQTSFEAYPSCVYYGLELKKNGEPKKNGKKRNAYQINAKEKNDETKKIYNSI
jgi:hypothetical protein